MSETPRQKGRPKDPLKTQAILQAARKLFLEQGLEVTTAEIARVAGVAKATLYANFSDKEHLIEAVLRQESDLTISDHDFAQRHHLPLIEVLTAFGYRFVRFINQRELTGWDRLIASAASSSIKRRISQALARRSTHGRRRVAHSRPRKAPLSSRLSSPATDCGSFGDSR